MTYRAEPGRKVMGWIVHQLKSGRERKDIEGELVNAGMEDRDARGLVGALQRKVWLASFRGGVISWVLVIGVILLLSGVLYAVQELAAKGG